MAPPFADDWLTRTPRANATINLFLFLRVSEAARRPNGNSVTNAAVCESRKLSHKDRFSGGNGRSKPQGIIQIVRPRLSKAARWPIESAPKAKPEMTVNPWRTENLANCAWS